MSELNDAILKASRSMLQKFNNRFNKSQRESEEVLSDWAGYLAIEKGYTVNQIGYALAALMQKGARFMPSAYEIESELTPPKEKKEDLAPIIVKEIIQLIRSWHPDLEHRMIEQASDDAKLVFQAIGNTADLRNSESFEIMSAQVERLVKGVLASKDVFAKNTKLESLGINTGRVLSFPNQEFHSLDFSGFLPNGTEE